MNNGRELTDGERVYIRIAARADKERLCSLHTARAACTDPEIVKVGKMTCVMPSWLAWSTQATEEARGLVQTVWGQ